MSWSYGDPVRVVIPGPPKALQRNRHRIITPKNGPAFVGNYLPAESRNQQAVMRDFAQQQMGERPPFEGPIDVRIVIYLPVPASWSKRKQAAALTGQMRPTGRPDADNCTKSIDAFKQVVWRDDAQITDMAVWKRFSDRPRLVIEVRPMTWQLAAPP